MARYTKTSLRQSLAHLVMDAYYQSGQLGIFRWCLGMIWDLRSKHIYLLPKRTGKRRALLPGVWDGIHLVSLTVLQGFGSGRLTAMGI